MAAQTFTVTNLGNSSLILDQFTFNTPAGIRHVANLVNFGGPEFFTSSEFVVVNPTLLPNQSKTFTVDHNYISGAAGAKTGNIEISSTSGKKFTICTNIVVGTSVGLPTTTTTPSPAPSVPSPTPSVPSPTPATPTPGTTPPTPSPTPTANPEYVLTTDALYNTAKEGTSVKINLTTTNVQPGTEVPYTIAASPSAPDLFRPSDIDIPTSGSFTIDSQGKASINISIIRDYQHTGDKVFLLSLVRNPDVNIPVVISDIE